MDHLSGPNIHSMFKRCYTLSSSHGFYGYTTKVTLLLRHVYAIWFSLFVGGGETIQWVNVRVIEFILKDQLVSYSTHLIAIIKLLILYFVLLK